MRDQLPLFELAAMLDLKPAHPKAVLQPELKTSHFLVWIRLGNHR